MICGLRTDTACVALTVLALLLADRGDAADVPIAGTSILVRQSKIVKFVSKGSFPLPVSGSIDDPTLNGATLELFDVVAPGAGMAVYSLDASGWRALGKPAGSKGYRYRGRDDVVDPDPKGACRSVFIRDGVLRAVCRGQAMPLAPPFSGNLAVILTAGDTRYCAEYGGSTQRNSANALRRRNAPPPPSCPQFLGTNQCDLDTSVSRLTLQLGLAAVRLIPSGSIGIDCWAADGSGRADCSCNVLDIDAVNLLGIGDLCVAPAGPCGPGTAGCLAGPTIDLDSASDHNIGTCTGQTSCATLCDSYCDGLGTAYSSRSSSCEGFCQGGVNPDLACITDADCPGGTCPGLEPSGGGVHGGACNCVCVGEGLGSAAPAGAIACEIGVAITVERDQNLICGDSPPAITLEPFCGSLTTGNATGVTLRGNNGTDPDDQLPPGSGSFLSVDGTNKSCGEFAGGDVGGMALVGHLQFFDSALGDILMQSEFVCQ